MPEVNDYTTKRGKYVGRYYRRRRPFTVTLAETGRPLVYGKRIGKMRPDLQRELTDDPFTVAGVTPDFDPSTIYIANAKEEDVPVEEIPETLSHETLHIVLADIGEREATQRLDDYTLMGVGRTGLGVLGQKHVKGRGRRPL